MTTCLWKIVVLCVGGSWRYLSSARNELYSSFPLWAEKQRSLLVLQTSPWDSETAVFCWESCCSSHTPHTSRMLPKKKNNAKKGETGWFLLIFIVSSFIQVESCFVGILNVAKVAEHHCAKHILNVAVWRKVNSVSYSVSINMFNTFGCVLNLNIIHFQFESV